ncbi:uncharacterized protein LOC129760917 [Uranotaenia lowii]|uniref:uncharacterized protein LOC129760917 n=1 Tax=Uranotaenia lowii TaxID=190385 RepID=UPI002478C2A2|nr:uncharacterized protein LOC129760917 [Uranotaenia lowii]
MPSNQNQRQTRSQTKAIREAMKANLQIASSHTSENCGTLFEATFVEANRGHEKDCLSCDQRNDADKFMVQCMGCQGWEHFKCAGVTTANAHEIAYRCVMCRPRVPPPAPSSITVESTASSSRRARIARDLERLEEERKLHETAAKAQLDRDKTYLNKKYKLLGQQDEEDETDSARNKRSSQAGSCRVTDWMKEQSETVARSERNIVPKTSEAAKPVDFGKTVEFTLVSELGAAKTSTPVNKPVVNEEKTPAAVALDLAGWIVDLDHTSLQRTTGSISIGERQDIESVDTDEASMQNPSASKFPMVDIQPFLRLLKDVESSEQKTGAYPKPSQPEFEKWRLETENLRRVQSLQQQHAQENDIRRKREIELMNQLKLVEQQHRADVEKMQEKEAEYRRQIRRQEEERIEYRKQAEKALEERDRELSRLRFVEQELMSRLDQLSQQYKNLSSEINNGPTQLQNCKAAAGNSTLPQNVGPSSLRGNAKEAVSSFLLHPSTVPEVIETLRTLFGRPEQIVHHMVNKVRSTPAPKEHRLDMLLNFGLVVQNMCSHLKAVGLENHLSDPTLLKELVDKLPPTAQFNWAMYQTQFSHVNLNDFSKYMQHVTTATSRLVMNGGISNTTSKSKGKEFVHTHTEIVDDSEQPESSQTEQLNYVGVKTCVACQKSAHPLEKCFKFQIDGRAKEKFVG